MSVQVLKIRFPGLLVSVSVEQPHRRKEEHPSAGAPAQTGRDRVAQRFPSVAGIQPSLMKLQA